MKRLMLLLVLCVSSVVVRAENRALQEGTIVRMRMTDCLAARHAFMTAMGGAQGVAAEQCPEYVLVSDKVVYVIVGRSSDQLVPLAETTRFHFQNNEVMIRVDDARRDSRFHVKEMILRPEWDRAEKIAESQEMTAMRHSANSAELVNEQ